MEVIERCLRRLVERFRTDSSEPIDQLTSPLPGDRTNQTPAFSVSGLDFVGLLYVNNFGELQKSYIVLLAELPDHFTWNWCLI
ncbi:hypothetical protein TNCV_759561 [Trichonephila clavipes]|nr:hypothetical protein TNCV_759561 [Trichonephila clavipes]